MPLKMKSATDLATFSMGDNSAFGENANVGINMVGIMKSANIYVDDKPFLIDGEFES